jgi:glyoxylase-like metal-dependent hydrolase (beta-lactamase superfamily II)
MKSILCALACWLLLPVFVQAEDRGPPVPDYPADRITDNIYVIHGPLALPNPENQGFMNNPGIVLTSAGVVIIDPGSSVQTGEMVLRVTARLTKMPVVAVFNTHLHGDHWLGNQAIRAAYPEVPIYGHPIMLGMIATGEGKMWVTLMEQLTKGKTLGTEVVGPNRQADNGDEIGIGDTTFRIHHYGPAHTTSDLMIEVVEQHTVFLGDNVTNGRIPRIDGGSVAGAAKSCREILKTGAEHYVPGHGRSGDAGLVRNMLVYYDTIYDNVKALYEQGLSDFEMKAPIRAKLQAFANWEDFEAQLGKHISYTYLQVESDQFSF